MPEYPIDILDGMEHITALVDGFAAYAKHLREAIKKADELDEDALDSNSQKKYCFKISEHFS